MPKKQPDLTTDQSPSSILRYLKTCSAPLLEQFELDRLNAVANAQQQMREIMKKAVEDMGNAQLARLLIDHRRELLSSMKQAPLLSEEELAGDLLPAAALALPEAPRAKRRKKS